MGANFRLIQGNVETSP